MSWLYKLEHKLSMFVDIMSLVVMSLAIILLMISIPVAIGILLYGLYISISSGLITLPFVTG